MHGAENPLAAARASGSAQGGGTRTAREKLRKIDGSFLRGFTAPVEKQLVPRVALIVLRILAVILLIYAVLGLALFAMMIAMYFSSRSQVEVASVSFSVVFSLLVDVVLILLSIVLWIFAPRLSRLLGGKKSAGSAI